MEHNLTVPHRLSRYTTIIFALSDSLSLGCQALIFWIGGHWLASGEVPILGFFIVFMAMMNGAEGTGQALSLAPNASQATAASNRILNARETKLRDTVVAGDWAGDTDGGIKIELKDVHFKYATRNVWVLKGINITVEKGQFAALVGASGRWA
jgi:ATP-binding cassette, subfamily B (MDR/TAP), member 1